jgi:hypothetical protein
MAIKHTLNIYEVLERVANTKTRDAKVEVLREHESVALKDILRCAFDDVVQFTIPKGTPPYTPADESSVPANLLTKNKQLTYFVKGGQGDKLPQHRREKIFIDLLETIHPKDAEILLLVKDKNQPAKSVTKKLVQKAFPNLIRK